jgi:hypothetical protein
MKKLHTDSITNELVHSSFFPRRPAEKQEEKPRMSAPEPATAETVKPLIPQPIVTPVPKQTPKALVVPAIPVAAPSGRRYVRRTFDFFEDQIAYLTKASLEEKLAGGEGSMNSMVREALDTFIEKHRKK